MPKNIFLSIQIFDTGPINHLKNQFLEKLLSKGIYIKNINFFTKNIKNNYLLFIRLFFLFLLLRIKYKKIIIFDHQALVFAKLFKFKKIIYYEIENPFKSNKFNLFNLLIRITQSSNIFLISPDPFREKFTRRYYNIFFSTHVPNLYLSEYPSISEKKNYLATYSGRITDLTGADILVYLKSKLSDDFKIFGFLKEDHISPIILKKIKNIQNFYYTYDKIDDVLKPISKAETAIAFTLRNKIDIGTKYQTPFKVWMYMIANCKILTTDSKSLRYYFGNSKVIKYVSDLNDYDAIHKSLIDLSNVKVDVDDFRQIYSNGLSIYNLGIDKLLNFINKTA